MKPAFADRLAAWQEQHGRHQLPWQCDDPYRIWVSEIMLQQTQVATVLDYYPRFINAFPTVAALAEAEMDDVSALWSGLGYYSRARNLHHAARQVMTDFAGKMPRDRAGLETLKGIGRSTAAAIAVFAYGQKEAILDGNVKRVLARHAGIFGEPQQPAVNQQLWREAERRLPEAPATLRRYTQGLMDLGSLICTRRQPKCPVCPVAEDCFAQQTEQTAVLPTPKTRVAKPERATVMLIATDGARVWLTRRPDAGIWRNLWSLPEFDNEAAARAEAERFGEIIRIERLTPVRHVFTHYILHITPLKVVIKLRDAAAFLPHQTALAKGLPAPVRRLLTSLEPQQQLSLPL